MLLMWVLFLYAFFKLPLTIPIHFGASGKPDGYGNKAILFILPVIGTLIYFGLTWLNQYPQVYNYPIKITEANAQQQYTRATRMMRFLKVAILFIFALIILFTYLTATGFTNGLGSWFLPFSIAIFFAPTIYFIIQSVKK